MIFFFESFFREYAGLPNQSYSDMAFPIVSPSAYFLPSESGTLIPKRSYDIAMASKYTGTAQKKLVLGIRGQIPRIFVTGSQSANMFALIEVRPTIGSSFAVGPGVSPSNTSGWARQYVDVSYVGLPGLMVGSSNGIPVIKIMGAGTTVVHTFNLPGLSVDQEHFYEVEYDLENNIIQVYVDALPLEPVTYDMSAYLDSGQEFQTRLSIRSHDYGYNMPTTVQGFYMADEVLGPVEFRQANPTVVSYASNDLQGSDIMDALADVTGTTDTVSSSLDNQSFLASGVSVPQSEEVLAVRLVGKFSSKEVSVVEVDRPVGIQLESADGKWESPTKSLQKQTNFQYHSLVLSSNPITGSPWTPAALNAMQFGLKSYAPAE